MTEFSELIYSANVNKQGGTTLISSSPSVRQRNAAERFPVLAMRHGFRLWRPANLKNVPSLRIVVGVSTASPRDMQFLDKLQTFIPRVKFAKGSIEVFNTYYFQTVEEIKERLPNIDTDFAFQTPFIEIWEDGHSSFTGSGEQARTGLIAFVNKLEQPDELFQKARGLRK